MAILNSTAPPADFSPQEYQCLIGKYLALSQENDRLVRAIRSGNQVDIDHIRQVLQTDFPLYVQLQDYFSRLRAEDLGSVVQTSFVPEDPVLGSRGAVRPSLVDANVEGDSEMHLASECDPDAMSMFSSTEAGAFAERPPVVPNQGPFGIRFSDFPPRVISQMLSAHTDVAASGGGWSSRFFTQRISSPLTRSLVAGVVHVGRFWPCQSSEEIHEGTNDRPGCYEWERPVRKKKPSRRGPHTT